MMSASRVAQLTPFLILVYGLLLLGCTARNADPVFGDLSTIFGDVCGFPLSVDIHDNQFSASSWVPGNEPHMARFNEGLAGWRAESDDIDQWIQVDLPTKISVTGILTQGSPDYDFYVTQYKVDYSLDGEHWSCVLDMKSQSKIFEGNVANSTPNINNFRPAITANFIRIKPVKWIGAISLRLEVFGGGCEKCWED